jgi:hypothetical protein
MLLKINEFGFNCEFNPGIELTKISTCNKKTIFVNS